MKIKETLTIQQTVQLINGNTVGFFETMILDTDAFYSSKYDLCLGYYMERSGDKTISPTYARLMELKNQNSSIVQTADQMLGTIIRNKFIDKWTRQYEVLIAEQYDALSDYEHNETKQRVDTDTTSYDTTITNDGNTGTEMETTYSATDNDSIYGFNSTSAVPTDSTTSNSNDITSGASENNTRHNTETKDGTDTRNFDSDETREILGRRKSAPELIEKELDLRNREIFFDIIYTDIDSIATIGIYTIPQDRYNPIKEYILSIKVITENGTYLAINDGADGYSQVRVDVPIPEGYVKPEGEIQITSNGNYDVTNYVSANVNLPIDTPTLIEKEITANGTYNATDDGADGYSSVVVDVPTPTPTTEEKTVTPTKQVQEVTPTEADYLSKVTVNAIPNDYIIPSGSVTITKNSTVDVTDKAQVVVNVPATEPKLQAIHTTIYENYTSIVEPEEGYDGLSYVSITTEVADSPLPIQVSTEEEMTALLSTAEVGSIYKYTGTTGTYENGALYIVEESEATTISFTIENTILDDVTYQAIDGWTWSDFVNSEYNPENPSIVAVDADGVWVTNSVGVYGNVQYQGVDVSGTDLIIANATYTIRANTGGFE